MNIEYICNTLSLTKERGNPIHLQLSGYFKQQLKSGVLQPGERMPSEEELFQALHLSRTTIRRAINDLVAEGYLVRYRARGTFVREPQLTRKMNHLYSFTADMRAIGRIPSSIIISQSVIDIRNTPVQQKLELDDENAIAFRLQRIRCADDKPILIEDTHIPYELCAGIENYDFSKSSLYDILNRIYGLQPDNASETLQAILLPAQVLSALDCPANTPGYRIDRIGRTDTRRVYEYTSSITRADICLYQFELSKASVSNAISSMVIQEQG